MTSTPGAPSAGVPSADRPTAGAPFATMLRFALLPSAIAGALTVIAMVLWRGSDALAGSLLGLVVSIAFYATGMLLMSRLMRSTSPHAFFAVAMAVYLGQVIGLLLFLMAFLRAAWVDGMALGLVALVVTITWQGCSMWAMRKARIPLYDLPDGPQ